MPTPYKIVTRNLNTASTKEPFLIFERNTAFLTVSVQSLPVAAIGNIFLHIGAPTAPAIPLQLEGQQFKLPAPEIGGLFLTVPTSLGDINLVLLVGVAVVKSSLDAV